MDYLILGTENIDVEAASYNPCGSLDSGGDPCPFRCMANECPGAGGGCDTLRPCSEMGR